MSYEIKLDIFEGPLDLLLYLIRKNEIDIYNIPIALITEQYLSYLDLMRSLNLDLAGEYLVLASTLVHIKSKLLLPPAEGEGEVIVTSLDARAMPFLRYRLGDRSATLAGPCACGSSFPRIAAPSGRVWDVVRLPSGRQLSPVAFQVVLRNVDGIDQYRIVQQAPDRFDVTIVPGPSFAADALPVLKERLAAVLGEPVAVDLRLSGFMTPEGRKFKVFESRLPSAG